MLCFSARCTACSVLNDMTTTFTADSPQKQIRRDTKHEIFAFVEEDSVGTTKHFKSEVWKTFKLVKVVASGFIIPNLCCCHKCASVLSYNAKSGTSHLKRHVDACITKKVTGAINQYLNKTVTLTNAEKDSLKLLQMKPLRQLKWFPWLLKKVFINK